MPAPVPLKLFLASSNPGKLREFAGAAADAGIAVEPVPGIQTLPRCVEDGETFEANARKKALHYAAFTHGLIFADDSGLLVNALEGAPGVYSARFSGPDATDESNNQKLIQELRRRTPVLRGTSARPAVPVDAPPSVGFAARYVCVIALAQGRHCLAVTEGHVNGVVIDTPRGAGGFGYDPYFFYPPLGKTFAEISARDKFAVSHRGIAFRKLLDYLNNAQAG
jgi:XTP/dITP diphosphohydrolase